MKERPILFSGEMVRAILEGRKSMTRRVIKQAFDGFDWAGDVHPARLDGWVAWWPGNTDPEFTKKVYDHGFLCPFGQPGDRLWVRETMHTKSGDDVLWYSADNSYRAAFTEAERKWIWKQFAMTTIPSIHMPRWASRITIEITDVGVERLQEITEEDAIREGVLSSDYEKSYRYAFSMLWDSLNGKKYPWEMNPWVWAISFKRIQP